MDYDIIVAGGGVAGSLAAASAAKNGAKVVLLDRNPEQEVGKKTNWGWVCGDAVAEDHIRFVEKELGVSFGKPELDLKVGGVYVVSPSMKKKVMFEGAGYSLNRPAFARKLLSIAKKENVDYMPKTEVEGPIIEGEKVVGVYGKDESGKGFELKAKVVIDALGMASTLRRKLPKNDFIEREVDIHDIESTGRYIMEFEQIEENDYFYDPHNAIIHLNQLMAPGGYGWVFPKEGKRVNIGIGIEKKSIEIRNEKLGKKDTLHSLIDQYVEWNKAIKKKEIAKEDNNGKGYWSVSVRRQQESLVYNGYMGAGDSMSMPNPISAGGIGPAMTAGVLAGKVAAKAVQNNNTSIEGLWEYNLIYNEKYGKKTAALEAFRVYLQSLNNDLIDYGMEHFVTEEEAIQMSYGVTPEISFSSALKKAISGLANINAFKNLVYVVGKMRELNALYQAYPKNPREFGEWKGKVKSIIKEVKERFKPNPV
ncbi:MAG: NAD(P)/FAD-dependent oxidoreductase [Candidatus Micrarchaeia archaeon]|jgi:geranylgeranyl reductase family protein